MAPKQSGHMNITPDVAAPAHSASQLDLSSQARRSALPLLDSVAYDPCPSRWRSKAGVMRVVPLSLALFGAMAFGSTDGIMPVSSGVEHVESSSMSVSLSELARVARMQLVAADAAYAPQALTGAASELTPSAGADRGSRSERSKQRREAAEARRAAAKERREAAKQARLEARAARKARREESDDDDEQESSSASDRRAAAKEKREARREAMAERRAAAKEKREAAAAERREAAEARRAAYAERRAAAKEKRESASESKHASVMERREAAKEKREAALAARREAAEERRAAAEEKREARRAARAGKEERADSSSVASSGMGRGGTFGHAEASMAPANGAALLRINSRPWAQVYVDGRLVGNTPQLALQLPPGEHNVRLVNGIFAMGKVLNVKLRAGERVTKVEMLEE